MPITFSCNRCQQSLQVDDSLAGQTVACPKCGNQQVVAAQGPFSFSSPQNPYQSPSSAGNFTAPVQSSGQMFPTQYEVGWVFNHALALWKQNLGFLVGMVAIVFGISMGISLVDLLLTFLMSNIKNNGVVILFLALKVLLWIAAGVVFFWTQIGQLNICLSILRGQRPSYNQLFSGGDVFWPVLGISILFGIAVNLGFMLLIIPGFLVLLYCWPVYYLVLDKKSRVLDSFNNSLPFTKINVLNSFLMFLIGYVINLLGVIACCVGLLFSSSLVMLFTTACYLAMTGQLQQHSQEQPRY